MFIKPILTELWSYISHKTSQTFLITVFFSFVGCGGGSSGSEPTPAPLTPDFSAVEQAIIAFEIDDMSVLIGDSDGVVYSFEKGSFEEDQIIPVASATKMITGLTIWKLIESGQILLSDNPQAYIDFWSADPLDEPSQVNIEHLLGFTSGFNNNPLFPGCIADTDFSLSECIQDIYDDGVGTPPGTAFYYGPEHMQVAALMAEEATNTPFQTLMRDLVFTPAGVNTEVGFLLELGDNPKYSADLQMSAIEYGKILTAFLAGDLVSDVNGYLEDRTANVEFGWRPAAIEGNDLDWHYGFGFWKECDQAPYLPSCDASPIISSAGAFGFTPWIDIENEYWAVIAMEESPTILFSPSAISTEFEQLLQPLIVEALAD